MSLRDPSYRNLNETIKNFIRCVCICVDTIFFHYLCHNHISKRYNANFDHIYLKVGVYKWDCFHEKGPNACFFFEIPIFFYILEV